VPRPNLCCCCCLRWCAAAGVHCRGVHCCCCTWAFAGAPRGPARGGRGRGRGARETPAVAQGVPLPLQNALSWFADAAAGHGLDSLSGFCVSACGCVSGSSLCPPPQALAGVRPLLPVSSPPDGAESSCNRVMTMDTEWRCIRDQARCAWASKATLPAATAGPNGRCQPPARISSCVNDAGSSTTAAAPWYGTELFHF
jgi:hypothetical protein